jgi:hypothetical protein
MKIIGSRPGGYIVDVTDGEIDCLASSPVRHGYRERQIGRLFNVSDAWVLIQRLRSQVDLLGKTASQLRCMADLLEPIVTTAEEVCEVKEENPVP